MIVLVSGGCLPAVAGGGSCVVRAARGRASIARTGCGTRFGRSVLALRLPWLAGADASLGWLGDVLGSLQLRRAGSGTHDGSASLQSRCVGCCPLGPSGVGSPPDRGRSRELHWDELTVIPLQLTWHTHEPVDTFPLRALAGEGVCIT
jgi:hypothetical protein